MVQALGRKDVSKQTKRNIMQPVITTCESGWNLKVYDVLAHELLPTAWAHIAMNRMRLQVRGNSHWGVNCRNCLFCWPSKLHIQVRQHQLLLMDRQGHSLLGAFQQLQHLRPCKFLHSSCFYKVQHFKMNEGGIWQIFIEYGQKWMKMYKYAQLSFFFWFWFCTLLILRLAFSSFSLWVFSAGSTVL